MAGSKNGVSSNGFRVIWPKTKFAAKSYGRKEQQLPTVLVSG
jgi:hypothetical protein